ncbi:hypothetical protein Tco_0163739 [Tanacetum coccineum]
MARSGTNLKMTKLLASASICQKWGCYSSEDDVDGESDRSGGSVMERGDGVRRGGGRRVAGKSDGAGKL